MQTQYDYVVIGAGPAGLQIAHHLISSRRKVMVLERAAHAGAFFSTFPRHRKLISINKIYTGYDDPEINLRWDWNSLLEDDCKHLRMTGYTQRYFPDADDLVRYLNDYAKRRAIPVSYGEDVLEISKPDAFEIRTRSGGIYSARSVVVATGVSKPYIPQFPGREHIVQYSSMDVNSQHYCGKRVLIVGKGNSAFETADSLIETASMIHLVSPSPLKMAWSTHYVGHLRAVNNNILDTYQLKSQNAILDASIESITESANGLKVSLRYEHAEGEVEDIFYDVVIGCTGFGIDSTIFAKNCLPELTQNDRFPSLTSSWESKNIGGLYFAGTLSQSRDFKKTASGFIHGFRYNVRTLSHLLGQKYHKDPYPSSECQLSVDGLLGAMLRRISQTSSLWQQPGYLCDAYEICTDSGMAILREDLPFDFAQEWLSSTQHDYLLLTLEFGQIKYDFPFAAQRIARDNIDRAAESNFLHPVIRYFTGLNCIAEHHVIEDLAGEWSEPEHVIPLQKFLASVRCLTVAAREEL